MSAWVFALSGIASAQGQTDPGVDLNKSGLKTPGFVENKGQWDTRALFFASQPGIDYWVTRDGIKVDLYDLEFTKSKGGPTKVQDQDTEYRRSGHVINFRFNGAGMASEPWGYGPADYPTDFFVGPTSKHARGVKTFREGYIRSLYPGVHLRNYLDHKGPRYDVVIEPGVDPNQVSFDVIGADSVRIDRKGDLVIGTSMGDLKHTGLFAYQPIGNARRQVDVRFVMRGTRTVAFELGEYDPRRPVIIDPLVYGTYIGGATIGYDDAYGLTSDDAGNMYVTGATSSTDFPVTDGPYGFNLSGGKDAYLARLQADSYKLTYVIYIGDVDDDEGRAIGWHRDSNTLWISGITASANFPGTAGSGTSLVNAQDIFLTSFIAIPGGSITPVSSRYYVNAGPVFTFESMVVSEAGDVYLCGSGGPFGFMPFLPGGGGAGDAFVTKFDSSMTVLWERNVGSTNTDQIGGMDVDSSGNVVVAGSFAFTGIQDTATDPSPVYPTTAGVYPQGRLVRAGDMFIAVLDTNGTTIWSSVLGGSASDHNARAAFGPDGSVYVFGISYSFDYPRNQGAYDESVLNEVVLTRISKDGASLLYSTGLRTFGTGFITTGTGTPPHNHGPFDLVLPRHITVDNRGIAALVGEVVPAIPSHDPDDFQPTQGPGAITLVGELDGEYDGWDETVDVNNVPDTGEFPSTRDGFVIFMNASGTNVLFADYIGQESDEFIRGVHTDSVNATWIYGHTVGAIERDSVPPILKTPVGVAPFITGNAAKFNVDPWLGDGFAIKLRISLPIMSSVTVSPPQLPGGLEAKTEATIVLRDPAPVGGVTMTATLSNPNATSFSTSPGDTTRTVTIPEGEILTMFDILTLPVTAQEISDLKVFLDNDFVEDRITVRPWLEAFSVSPATAVGGTALSVRVDLEAPALQSITVTLSTDRPDIVTLPSPGQIIVPTGVETTTAQIQTIGVDSDQDFTLSASLLGVTVAAPGTLVPASLINMNFVPAKVNGGSDSVATVILNGLTGSARILTISQSTGPGVTIGGNALPTTVIVPAQSDRVSFMVTTPAVSSPTSATLSATDGTTTATGTLFIDDIDILEFIVMPATDVISGTVLTCQIKLSRIAGIGGFTVDLANSNPAAGALSETMVTIAEGSQLSPQFTFTADVVSTDQVTTLSASKAGYTTRTVDVTVRAMTLVLSIDPTVVVGGVSDSVGTVTLSAPAPATGLTIAIVSGDDVYASVPAFIVVPGGATTETFDIVTAVTQDDRFILITATASGAVSDAASLAVLAPGIVSLSIDPPAVTGPDTAVGTVVLGATAPAGGLTVALAATPPGVVTLPATVTVLEGSTSATFNILTSAVNLDAVVTVTATIGGSVANATLTVRSPIIAGITFSPPRILGGGIAIGTITLDQPAPGSGTVVNLVSHDPTLAFIIGPSTITIQPGSRTGTFSVQTTRMTRIIAVRFTGGPAGSSQVATGYLYIKP